VDAEGLDVSAGVRLARKARGAIVTPSHQFPLGAVMTASRRLQLLDWAEQAGAWIIEDDYDSEYRYGAMPISSLQGLDRNQRVVYIGTFSKTLFPAIRIGYIVVPPDLVDPFLALRHSADLFPPLLYQDVLRRFIEDGHYSRHIRRTRQIYEERRNVLVDSLRSEFDSSLPIIGSEAGLHLVVTIPRHLSDREIALQAAESKLWLYPLSLNFSGKRRTQGFVLGYGSAGVPEIRAGIRRLHQFLGKVKQPQR
jgi:GntR family transcriptional regulator/MocR family aminotransferase